MNDVQARELRIQFRKEGTVGFNRSYAKILQEEGNFALAADWYAAAGDLKEAHECLNSLVASGKLDVAQATATRLGIPLPLECLDQCIATLEQSTAASLTLEAALDLRSGAETRRSRFLAYRRTGQIGRIDAMFRLFGVSFVKPEDVDPIVNELFAHFDPDSDTALTTCELWRPADWIIRLGWNYGAVVQERFLREAGSPPSERNLLWAAVLFKHHQLLPKKQVFRDVVSRYLKEPAAHGVLIRTMLLPISEALIDRELLQLCVDKLAASDTRCGDRHHWIEEVVTLCDKHSLAIPECAPLTLSRYRETFRGQLAARNADRAVLALRLGSAPLLVECGDALLAEYKSYRSCSPRPGPQVLVLAARCFIAAKNRCGMEKCAPLLLEADAVSVALEVLTQLGG